MECQIWRRKEAVDLHVLYGWVHGVHKGDRNEDQQS